RSGPGRAAHAALPDAGLPAARGAPRAGRRAAPRRWRTARRAGPHGREPGRRAGALSRLAPAGPDRAALRAARSRAAGPGAPGARPDPRVRVVRDVLSPDLRERRAHRGLAALER